ncbi:BCCT family transporter [Streptomyces fractus]|uniref:BCCT family transporter n=1 Tax=Streptomyces fractus TaxID=641806 RepID=UPI003CEE5F59
MSKEHHDPELTVRTDPGATAPAPHAPPSADAGLDAGPGLGPDADTGAINRPDRFLVLFGLILVLAVVVWALLWPGSFSSASSAVLGEVLTNFDWLFVLAADTFLVLAVWLVFSRFGRIRLGKDSDRPEFSRLAWIAMMFSAGMGIGLMFYGVGEPLQHYMDPGPGAEAIGQTTNAAQSALEYSLFHWTLTPWAIYGVAALALAYSCFRKGRGNTMSAAFVPFIGERRARGWLGKVIDLLAVFATVFGTATSLGIGTLQVAQGLDITTGITQTEAVEMIIIIALTAAFAASAFSGLNKGVKWLSTLNVILAALLMMFVFLFGPTTYILDTIPASVGGYLDNLIPMATRTDAFSDPSWMGSWTIFYWAWWISWAPFVGTFIARISKGRTIREFLVGVLLVPSGATVVWFCVMGGTGLHLAEQNVTAVVNSASDAEASLFAVLDQLPFGAVTSVLAMILVMTYFITSADSASLVMGSLTSRGALHPRRWLVVTWGLVMSTAAAALLLAGGLDALQSATIVVALPFVLVLLGMCAALVRELRADPAAGPGRRERARARSQKEPVPGSGSV